LSPREDPPVTTPKAQPTEEIPYRVTQGRSGAEILIRARARPNA
jgi:hypothetical protein